MITDLTGSVQLAFESSIVIITVARYGNEKLCFDEKKYRTVDLNPAVELILNGIKPFEWAQKNKPRRIETCLVWLPHLDLNQGPSD